MWEYWSRQELNHQQRPAELPAETPVSDAVREAYQQPAPVPVVGVPEEPGAMW